MSKDKWDLSFKQRIWLEWLKENKPHFIKMISMDGMIDYVLMKGYYNKEQQEKLNDMRATLKKEADKEFRNLMK